MHHTLMHHAHMHNDQGAYVYAMHIMHYYYAYYASCIHASESRFVHA